MATLPLGVQPQVVHITNQPDTRPAIVPDDHVQPDVGPASVATTPVSAQPDAGHVPNQPDTIIVVRPPILVQPDGDSVPVPNTSSSPP